MNPGKPLKSPSAVTAHHEEFHDLLAVPGSQRLDLGTIVRQSVFAGYVYTIDQSRHFRMHIHGHGAGPRKPSLDALTPCGKSLEDCGKRFIWRCNMLNRQVQFILLAALLGAEVYEAENSRLLTAQPQDVIYGAKPAPFGINGAPLLLRTCLSVLSLSAGEECR